MDFLIISCIPFSNLIEENATSCLNFMIKLLMESSSILGISGLKVPHPNCIVLGFALVQPLYGTI